MNSTDWTNRPALVTGASAGIGSAIARRLAAEGMEVIATARRLDRLKRLAAECAELPGRVVPVAADMRREADILEVFHTARAELGGIDLLVNNAGLGRLAPLSSGDTEHWREMLEVNVLGLCICTREVVQDLARRSATGHIVHISSMAAHRVPTGSGVYSATKHAVRALTEGLRMELREAGSQTRVTSISPGFVETEFAEVYTHGDPTAAERSYGQYPVLQPDDIADSLWHVITRPAHMQVHDVLIRPTEQPS